jgi:hypothetical protein
MRAKSWFVVSLVLLVASGVLLAGSLIHQIDPRESVGDFAAHVADALVTAALDRLAHEVAELRQAVLHAPPVRREVEQNATPTAAPLDPASPRAGAELCELVAMLQRVCDRQRESLAEAAARAPAQPVELLAELRAQSDEERTRRFRLSSYREVLDACGAPDEVAASPQGELLWAYDEPGGERKLWFAFVDGLVVRVFG